MLNSGENREPVKGFEEGKYLEYRMGLCHLREEEALTHRKLCISWCKFLGRPPFPPASISFLISQLEVLCVLHVLCNINNKSDYF